MTEQRHDDKEDGLLPCPHCGHTARIVTVRANGKPESWVQCYFKECGASANPDFWNKRQSVPFATQPTHTDHPLRHFDRTCPVCVALSSDGADSEPRWDSIDTIIAHYKLDTLSTNDIAALILRLKNAAAQGRSGTDGAPIPGASVPPASAAPAIQGNKPLLAFPWAYDHIDTDPKNGKRWGNIVSGNANVARAIYEEDWLAIKSALSSIAPTKEEPYWMKCKTCGSRCRSDAQGYRCCDGDPETGDRNCILERDSAVSAKQEKP